MSFLTASVIRFPAIGVPRGLDTAANPRDPASGGLTGTPTFTSPSVWLTRELIFDGKFRRMGGGWNFNRARPRLELVGLCRWIFGTFAG